MRLQKVDERLKENHLIGIGVSFLQKRTQTWTHPNLRMTKPCVLVCLKSA